MSLKKCAAVEIAGVQFGNMKMSKIKPYDVQKVQNVLAVCGMDVSAVNTYMKHLSHVFKTAVKDQTIDSNPCICIESLRNTDEPARKTIHRALSEQETAAFFQAAKGNVYYNAWSLMLQTGMRVGEVGALYISDVDFKTMTIRVNKTITRNDEGHFVVADTPKTDAGNREIPLTDQAVKVIRDQKNYNRLVFGDKVEGRLFSSAEGNLLQNGVINRAIEEICSQIGLEKFTCHALRATFATRFIEQRPQDYKILSEILGHSNINITLDLYTHVMKEKKIEAMRCVKIVV